MSFADTPEPPYYAVIFSAAQSEDLEGYAETAERMVALAAEQPGFLGVESVQEGSAEITVSYWRSLEDIAAWRRHAEHRAAQREGRARWYTSYRLRVARVERVASHDGVE